MTEVIIQFILTRVSIYDYICYSLNLSIYDSLAHNQNCSQLPMSFYAFPVPVLLWKLNLAAPEIYTFSRVGPKHSHPITKRPEGVTTFSNPNKCLLRNSSHVYAGNLRERCLLKSLCVQLSVLWQLLTLCSLKFSFSPVSLFVLLDICCVLPLFNVRCQLFQGLC